MYHPTRSGRCPADAGLPVRRVRLRRRRQSRVQVPGTRRQLGRKGRFRLCVRRVGEDVPACKRRGAVRSTAMGISRGSNGIPAGSSAPAGRGSPREGHGEQNEAFLEGADEPRHLGPRVMDT